MSILKAVLSTLLYVILFELVSTWLLLPYFYDLEFLFPYLDLIDSVLHFLIILPVLLLLNRKYSSISLITETKWYVFAAVLGLAYVFVQSPLNLVYDLWSSTEHKISYDFNNFSLMYLFVSVGTIFFVPIYEELFFREFLQKRLTGTIPHVWTIIIVAILFAVIHLPYAALFVDIPYASPHHAYIAFFGGVISGVLYWKSKSVGPSILFHMCWNLMVILE